MDGQYHIPDSDLVSLRTKNEVNKEKLPDLKKFFCNSVGKVFMRNLEFTSKRNDRRVFKVEFAREDMGVLFSTIDESKYLAESSLYIPFNVEQVNFLSSLVEKMEPMEVYRIQYYEKKIKELELEISETALTSDLLCSKLGHYKNLAFQEQQKLEVVCSSDC